MKTAFTMWDIAAFYAGSLAQPVLSAYLHEVL